MDIRAGQVSKGKCLSDEMQELRNLIDDKFTEKRGAMLAGLLLYKVHVGDAKGDLTVANAFALLVGDQYRCHLEVLFR